MEDAETFTVTVRVGDQRYANTIRVAPQITSGEAERYALDRLLWELRQQGIDVDAIDRRSTAYHWKRGQQPITARQRRYY